MKKVIVLSAMMLTALVAMAKDIKTVVVTTQPQMHCENCEKKIKGNLRFEKVSRRLSATSRNSVSPSPTMLTRPMLKPSSKASVSSATKPLR